MTGDQEQVITFDGVADEALPLDDLAEESAPTEQPSSEATASEVAEQEPADTVESADTVDDRTAEEIELADSALVEGEGQLAALTTPLESIDFIGAGVTWDASSTATVTQVALRVRENGEWSAWHDLDPFDDDVAAQEGSSRTGVEPLLSVGADAVQARVFTTTGEAPANLEITLIDPGEASTDGELDPAVTPGENVAEEAAPASATVPSIDPVTGQPIHHAQLTSATSTSATVNERAAESLRPAIVTRQQWGATESWASQSSQSSELKAMYIHHTAGTNNYTPAQAYGQLPAIYSYHTRSLRWGDIGYHFLIDRYGTIYEGRRGSLDSLPVGAQAGGFNTDTIGLSMIGNFDVAQPPRAMLNSVEQVLAWKAAQHDLDPAGTTQLTSRAGNSSTASYSYGTVVTKPVILGHRDTNRTACPGRYVYPLLPSIRTSVAQQVNQAKSDALATMWRQYQPLWITDDQTVLRSTFSHVARTLGTLQADAQVKFIRTYDNWVQIDTTLGRGWVTVDDVTDSRPNNAVSIRSGLTYETTRVTLLRRGASDSEPQLQQLQRGHRVVTQGLRIGDWWQVKASNGQVGWVRHAHLKVVPKQASRPAPQPAAVRIVADAPYSPTRTTPLRQGAGTSHRLIRNLTTSETVTTAGLRIGDWWQVKASNGQVGWVRHAHLTRTTKSASSTRPALTEVRIISGAPYQPNRRTHLRQEAGDGKRLLRVLTSSDTVTTEGIRYGDWWKVKTSTGQVGWVRHAHLTRADSSGR